jgi:hypothetical protein
LEPCASAWAASEQCHQLGPKEYEPDTTKDHDGKAGADCKKHEH